MFQNIKDVLKNKEFVKLWIGLTQSRLGSIINFVALALYVYQRTQSGFAVGKLEIAMVLPSVLVGFFAGTVVDKFNKKWVMVICDMMRAFLFLGMAFFTQVTAIYTILFSASIVSLFFSPAYATSIPLIVSKQHLLEANSLEETSEQLTRIMGPGLAGMMFMKFGFEFICIFNSITYIICAIIILSLNLPYSPNEKKKWGDFKAPLKDILDGLKYIRNDHLTASITTISAAVQLGAGAINALLVMFVKNALNGSDAFYGMIISAVAMGSVIGAFAPWFRGKLSEETVVKYSLLVLGTSILGFSINLNATLALLLLVVVGFSNTIVNILIGTLLQKHVPNQVMGRTFASMDVLARICLLISMGAGSMLADVIGVRMIYILASVIVLITAIAAFRFLSLEPRASRT